MRLLRSWLFFFLLTSLSLAVLAQRPTEGELWSEGWYAIDPLRLYYESYPFTKEQIAFARQRWRVIQDQLAQHPKDEWAGDYSLEGVEVLNNTILHWKGETGFVALAEYSCLNSVTNISFGGALFSGEQLQLKPELKFAAATQHSHVQALPEVFVPVKWGGAHYLIPAAQLAVFCNDYVAGRGAYEKEQDRPYVTVFIKRRERNKNRASLPIVPAPYSHLVKRPITTTVKMVGKPFFRDYADRSDEVVIPVYLNAGASSGVKPGMEFRLDSLDWGETVRIISVGSRGAKGEVTRLIGDDVPHDWRKLKKEDRPVVRIGQRATTMPAWRAVDGEQWMPIHGWQQR